MIAYQNILQATLSISYRAVPSSDGLRDGVWLGWKLEMLGHNVRLPLSLCEAVYQAPKKRYGRCRKPPWRVHCIMPLRFVAAIRQRISTPLHVTSDAADVYRPAPLDDYRFTRSLRQTRTSCSARHKLMSAFYKQQRMNLKTARRQH